MKLEARGTKLTRRAAATAGPAAAHRVPVKSATASTARRRRVAFRSVLGSKAFEKTTSHLLLPQGLQG